MPDRVYRPRDLCPPRGKVYKPEVRRGFVRIDGQTVCRIVPERRTLQFIDRDKQRAFRRRTRYIEVSIEELARACDECEQSESEPENEQA